MKVKVNTLMHGQLALTIGLSSLLAYCNKSPRLILIQKIVEVFGSTSRLQLVILASAFVAGNTLVSFLFALTLLSVPSRL